MPDGAADKGVEARCGRIGWVAGPAHRCMNKSPDLAGRPSQKRRLLESLLNEEGIGAERNAAISRRQNANEFPLSFAQKRLWLLDRVEPGPHYNDHFNLRLQGPLNASALQQGLDEIVRRHEALRATFATQNGEPIQKIAPPFNVPLPMADLTELPEPERMVMATQMAIETARAPIDLQHGPLLRAKLARLGHDDHLLILVIHHIAIDGWSRGVFLRELTALYEAFAAGRASTLPPPAIQYADFADWQQRWVGNEVLPKELPYWKKQLDGAPALLELPASFPRPEAQSFRGARQAISISRKTTEALKALSQREGCTLFMTLLAAFQALASRHTGQKDIVIGSPIANRNRAEIEGLIGWFANTLVLRADLSGNPTFRELMSRTRETALAAYAHQDLPYEKLVEELRPARNQSYNAVFQVMFVFQNAPMPGTSAAGVNISPFDIDSGVAKFDLTLNLAETPEGIEGWIEYATDLFDAGAISRLRGHYETLLESAVANPDQPVSKLTILTERERRQILVEWNATEVPYPRTACVHELFEEQAGRTPDDTAVICGAERLTYGELNARANQLAHFLRENGAGRNTLVGISVGRSVEMAVGILGILKSGAAYMPMDPAYPRERRAMMLQDSKAPILLTQQELAGNLETPGAKVVCLDRDWAVIATASRENPERAAGPEDLIYVIYTSGSTGRPKATGVYHRGFMNLMHWYVTEYAVAPEDRVLMVGSLSFDLIQKGIYAPWLRGGELHVLPPGPFDPRLIARVIEENRITLINCAPSTFYPVVDAPENFEKLASLRCITVGGEAMSLQRLKPWLESEHCKADAANNYGPTECSDISAAYWLTRANKDRFDFVPIGRPIFNAQLVIVDEEMQPCPAGVAGELCIGGEGVGAGYLNNPEQMAARFIANPFPEMRGAKIYRTGDLCRYLQDGNIQFLGRMDHQVKIRGSRVELREIESALAGHEAVREAVVVARDADSPAGPTLTAYFAAKDGVVPGVAELRQFLKEKLPDHMVPAAFVRLDKLPLSPNGKVDRRALPAPQPRGETESNSNYIAPNGPVEKKLGEIWAGVLRRDKVGAHDNFFDLGGHSLLMVQLHARICEAMKTDLPIVKLFQYPTVSSLAAHLGQSSAESAAMMNARDRALRQKEALTRPRPAGRNAAVYERANS